MESKITNLTAAEQEELMLEFAESIHAGFPSPAGDCAGERIDLVREMSRHPETTYYARISGESMRDAGLMDGDIVVIDKSLDPKDGDYVVAAIDGEFTIKEFRLDTEHQCAWLIPHNSDFQPIKVDTNDDFVIWGVITHAIHKF